MRNDLLHILYACSISILTCCTEAIPTTSKQEKKGEQIQKEEERTKLASTEYKEEYPWLEIQDEPFAKLLLQWEANTERKAKIDYKNQIVNFPLKGNPYSVRLVIHSKLDLNADGISDYIVSRISQGGLGGNVNNNTSLLVYIMNDKSSVNQRHEILLSAPFSYNILENLQIQKNSFTLKATQNYRTYDQIDSEELESKNLRFLYRDSNLYEESYLKNCILSSWSHKKLFPTSSQVLRTIDIHNYTETVTELVTTEQFTIQAEYSGCDNIVLRVEALPLSLEKNGKNLHDEWNNLFAFLKNSNYLTHEFQQMCTYIENNEIPLNSLEFHDIKWTFRNDQRDHNSVLILYIEQMTNKNQLENWGITKRMK